MRLVTTRDQRRLGMIAAILAIACLAALSSAPHAWAGSGQPNIALWSTATPTLVEASPAVPPASDRPSTYAYDTLGAARSTAGVGSSAEGASPHARPGGNVIPASEATVDPATTTPVSITSTPRGGSAEDAVQVA